MMSSNSGSFMETFAEQILGVDPPAKVYFMMKFEHNLGHPLNADILPEDASFESEPQRTMDEARVIAQTVAADWAAQHNLIVVPYEGAVDEDGIDFPSYMGIDPNGDVDDDHNIVFTAMVTFEDYRHETLH